MAQLPHKIDFAHVKYQIAPICLPKSGSLISKQQCSALGWGRIGPEPDSPSSQVLNEVHHSMLTAQECHHQRSEINDLQVCAGTLGHSTCRGDSGGPLQCRDESGQYTLIGITSYGEARCGETDLPAVFTNVERFISWINKIQAEHASN